MVDVLEYLSLFKLFSIQYICLKNVRICLGPGLACSASGPPPRPPEVGGHHSAAGGSEPRTLAGWGRDIFARHPWAPCPQPGLELPSPSSAWNVTREAAFDPCYGGNLCGAAASEGKPALGPGGKNRAFL